MPNPFATRATEHIPSTEGFLTVVTADPLAQYFKKYAEDNRLFQKLICVNGTPGSGKTTMARLLDFATLSTLMQGAGNENYKAIISTLNACSFLRKGKVRVASCRIPLESDFQELWQLPYSVAVRNELLMRLIQARAALGWLSQFERASIALDQVRIRVRENFEDLASFFGGVEAPSILLRAREVEKAIYGILGALIAPPETEIEERFVAPYKLFDCLVSFEIPTGTAERIGLEESIAPLIILDDAHCLHVDQLHVLKEKLTKREVRISRWILSRLDVLQPQELFESISAEQRDGGSEMPGTTSGRDHVTVNLQNCDRSRARREFRAFARRMGGKYIRFMEAFQQNGIQDLDSILPRNVEQLAESNLAKLEKSTKSVAKRFRVGVSRYRQYEEMVDLFAVKKGGVGRDVRLAMLRVVLARYGKRIPEQELLFAEEGPEPSRPLRADGDVYDAARIHLYHDYDRPYYVGIDSVCDASSENAEMFLRLTKPLVEASEANLLKQRKPSLDPRRQQRLLKERADFIVTDWNFPEHRKLRKVADFIGMKCLEITRRVNAPLGAGANAFGVLNEDFKNLEQKYPELARVLKFGVAYNAISLVPSYPCKNKLWCLLELGGPLMVHYGLPLKRGGFVEGALLELDSIVKEQ